MKWDSPLWLKIEADYWVLLSAYERCYNMLKAVWHFSEEELNLINIHNPKIFFTDNFCYKEELEKAHKDLHTNQKENGTH